MPPKHPICCPADSQQLFSLVLVIINTRSNHLSCYWLISKLWCSGNPLRSMSTALHQIRLNGKWWHGHCVASRCLVTAGSRGGLSIYDFVSSIVTFVVDQFSVKIVWCLVDFGVAIDFVRLWAGSLLHTLRRIVWSWRCAERLSTIVVAIHESSCGFHTPAKRVLVNNPFPEIQQ